MSLRLNKGTRTKYIPLVKVTCGDVDILLSHADGLSHEKVLPALVEKLTKEQFLTDHLVLCQADNNQRKYMGVCLLPPLSHSSPPRLVRPSRDKSEY